MTEILQIDSNLSNNISSIIIPSYDVTRDHIDEQISQGYPFIYMATHGTVSYWTTEIANENYYHYWGPANLAYTIVATTACSTNKLNQAYCFGAYLFRNSNAKIVGYYGGSSQTHGHVRRWHIGSANKIIGHFFKGLFQTNGAHYGDAVMASKIDNINECKSYKSSFRWDFFSFNSLGDPEMPVFTSTPNTFLGISVIYQNGLCSVSTGGVEGCNICVMSKNDNGASYYSVKKNVQEASFYANVDACNICITKTGYLPYITSASNITYIQNQTLTGNNTINSSETYIGRNVTTQVSQGDVILQNGSLTINSSNKTVIKNSFKVNTGAALRIERSN